MGMVVKVLMVRQRDFAVYGERGEILIGIFRVNCELGLG